jgi:heme/copper-type cytochrome/quinol oxidase subunit 2
MSNKKRWKIIVGVVVLVFLVAVVWGYMNSSVEPEVVEENGSEEIVEEEDQDPYRSEVATNTVVPEKDDVVEDERIAVPKAVAPAAPNVESKFRSFDIVASEGMFKPSEIVVNEGDTVHVDFSAEDGEYDITFPSYGMKQTASAGETKILEFQANQSGSFLYYCESCGGEESLATGNIVVVAKE